MRPWKRSTTETCQCQSATLRHYTWALFAQRGILFSILKMKYLPAQIHVHQTGRKRKKQRSWVNAVGSREKDRERVCARVCLERKHESSNRKKHLWQTLKPPRPLGAEAWTLWGGLMSARRESRSALGQKGGCGVGGQWIKAIRWHRARELRGNREEECGTD